MKLSISLQDEKKCRGSKENEVVFFAQNERKQVCIWQTFCTIICVLKRRENKRTKGGADHIRPANGVVVVEVPKRKKKGIK